MITRNREGGICHYLHVVLLCHRDFTQIGFYNFSAVAHEYGDIIDFCRPLCSTWRGGVWDSKLVDSRRLSPPGVEEWEAIPAVVLLFEDDSFLFENARREIHLLRDIYGIHTTFNNDTQYMK